jgi:hypothetical protein
MRKLSGIQIRPRHAAEFDRRVNSLKPSMVRDIVVLLDSLPSSRDALNRYLFSSFDLDKADRSLVMTYEDYLAIYSDQVSNFFFSSTEDSEEYNRRKLILEKMFGTRARTLVRKKISPRKKAVTEEIVLAVPEHTLSTAVDISAPVDTKAEAAELVDEDSLWDYVLSQKDSEQLIKELKRLYEDLVEDPSAVLEDCNRLGIAKFTTRVRRSYIFK